MGDRKKSGHDGAPIHITSDLAVFDEAGEALFGTARKQLDLLLFRNQVTTLGKVNFPLRRGEAEHRYIIEHGPFCFILTPDYLCCV